MSLNLDDPNFSFPTQGGFNKTSEASLSYNCIAWAAGVEDAWWWPDILGVAYWPPGLPREETREVFVAAYALLGYEVCTGASFEEGYEKIALFEKKGIPSHAARLIMEGPHRGRWTSKMGGNVDIVHELRAVEGRLYGTVSVYLRRRVAIP